MSNNAPRIPDIRRTRIHTMLDTSAKQYQQRGDGLINMADGANFDAAVTGIFRELKAEGWSAQEIFEYVICRAATAVPRDMTTDF